MSAFFDSSPPDVALETLIDRYAPEQIPLDRAALAIASPHVENVSPKAVFAKLDELASHVLKRAGEEARAEELLDSLLRTLFEENDFRGNRTDYYNPANSFLPSVLETRVGIPISLSLLAIEVGRRVGLPLVGIALPCHFMVGAAGPAGMRYFDPYFGGVERTESECSELVRKLSDGACSVTAEHFLPVSPQKFLSRMLVNLRCIYRNRGEGERLAVVLEQLIALNPCDASLHLEAATVWTETGDPWKALSQLKAYLEKNPDCVHSPQILAWIDAMSKKLAILN